MKKDEENNLNEGYENKNLDQRHVRGRIRWM